MIRQFAIRGGYDNYRSCVEALTGLNTDSFLLIACGHELGCPATEAGAHMRDCDCPEIQMAVEIPDGRAYSLPRLEGLSVETYRTPEEALERADPESN